MHLQTKLILAFLFLAAVPIASSYWRLTTDVYETITLQRDLFRAEQLESLANQLDWNMVHAAESLRLGLEAFDLARLEERERLGVLRILYQQRPYLSAIRLLDSQGMPVGQVVRLRSAEGAVGRLAGHVPVANDEIASLDDRELIAEARKKGIAWGTPIDIRASREDRHVPVVMTIGGQHYRFMAAALFSVAGASGAREAITRFAQSRAQGLPVVYLTDRNGDVLMRAAAEGTAIADIELPAPLNKWLEGGGSGQIETEIGNVPEVIAWHRLENLGWRVVTAQPKAVVDEAVRKPMRFVVYWAAISVLIAVVYGFYFSRTLARPIRELAAGVLEVARGNLDARVKVQTRDEVGELAETFNYMAGELASQKAEIERQSEEIRSWNRELQARVDERTRELKEAQGYLIHTQKLAAVAELGSGVAHELNNPLAAVLGFVQILIAQFSEVPQGSKASPEQTLDILKRVEAQTQRCREIVHHLLRFSQEQMDRGSYDLVDVSDAVRTVLKLFEGSFASKKITVENMLEGRRLMSWGNRAQLLQAFLQLFSAVRSVAPEGATIRVVGDHDDQVSTVIISGPLRALESAGGDLFRSQLSQDQAMAQGLGLWVAREVFQEHQGGLEIEIMDEDAQSDEARLVVTLPFRVDDRNGGRPADRGDV